MFGRRRRGSDGPIDEAGESLANLAVVEAMRNLSVAETTDGRAMLFQLLLDTTLLAATPNPPVGSGSRIAGPGESLNLVTLADDEGSVLPLFTSIEAVSRWREEPTGYVAIPGRVLFEMAAANGTNKIALDPGSTTWGLVTRYEIEQLGRGRLPLGRAGDVVADATEVRIGKPASPPSADALTAIREQLEVTSSVVRAWYFMMQQGALDAEMVIAIQFEPGIDPDRDVMRTIIDAAGEGCEEVKSFSFIVATESWQNDLSRGAGESFFMR